MKKIAIAIVLLCALYSAYSLDYRQVIFGNTYQNIIEIDADTFFEQYPAVKEYIAGNRDGRSQPVSELDYYHVYEQIIDEKTFYRVLFNNERLVGDYGSENKKLTATDFLNWRKIYFTQYVFFKKSDTELLQLGDGYEFGRKNVSQYSDNPKYEGLEIIERNNQLTGIMKYTVQFGYSQAGLEEPGFSTIDNSAFYCLWSDVLQYEEKISPTISYINWQNNPSIPEIVISTISPLIDSKRPFMYTLQNAFDDNPATSYVEDTDNDMFRLTIWLNGGRYTEFPECTSYKISNGYASGDSYYQNNQIAKIAVGFVSDSSSTRYISRGSVQLKDTVKPQVMSFEVMKDDAFYMEVEEITKGTMYSDTCLAEFDIYFEGDGWLFGSSDTDTIVVSPTKVDAYEYEYTIKDGTAEIKRYNGEATELTIPSTIEHQGKTYPVTSIGESAFQWPHTLTSVTIPDSVTSIGDFAFFSSRLRSITIPDSVTSIGEFAFSECYNLTTITIPNSITSIRKRTFSNSGLTSINIPDSITSIGEAAFLECGNLTSITIPNSVTSIGAYAFSGSSLPSIAIPDSVTSIGTYVFAECENLTSITIPDSITSIGEFTFDNSGLTSITIPSSVTSIGEYAFRGSNLTSITIPNSVTSIGDSAFYRCDGLTSVTIPSSVTSIGSGAFRGCKNLTSITIPSSVTSIGERVFWDCENLTLAVFPDSDALFYADWEDIPYVLVGEVAEVSTELENTEESATATQTVPWVIGIIVLTITVAVVRKRKRSKK